VDAQPQDLAQVRGLIGGALIGGALDSPNVGWQLHVPCCWLRAHNAAVDAQPQDPSQVGFGQRRR
jgi:hypothetical protein